MGFGQFKSLTLRHEVPKSCGFGAFYLHTLKVEQDIYK